MKVSGGLVNVHNGNPCAVPNGYMASDSLTIRDTAPNYGSSTSWSSSTAGIMMECADYTEIAVHDSGTKLASLMYHDRVYNNIYIYWS